MSGGNYDASNARKSPLGLSLNQFAQKKIADAIAQLGGELPCRVIAVAGQIVTVSFEIDSAPFTLPQVSMPIATSVYDWIPVQVGDRGLTSTSDVYLGGVSGLGGGVADLSRPGNLGALMFVPVANAGWLPPAQTGGNADPNVRVVQGPAGVLIQDQAGTVTVRVDPTAKTGGVTVRTTGHLPITLDDGQSTLVLKGNGLNTITGQSITVQMTSQINLYAPDTVIASGQLGNALPLTRSDGSFTTKLKAE